jgi:integrase
MPLTDTAIRAAKPAEKPYKVTDGQGLYLLVAPTGSRLWRFKYRFAGKEKLLALGAYPAISLRDARAARDEARASLAHGNDPGQARQADKRRQRGGSELDAESFQAVAREWYVDAARKWTPGHAVTVLARLENDVFPELGRLRLSEIDARTVLQVLRRVEARGALETAHRIRTVIGQVFTYAIALGLTDRNPAAALAKVLPSAETKHMAAITDPTQAGGLLRAIDDYTGGDIVRWALRLAPLVFLRPGELRQLEWREVDLEAAQIAIPAERMKLRVPHLVPLSRQASEILEAAQAFTGDGRYVFPGERTSLRPMSEGAILAALRRMGFAKGEMTGHGFRAMARTILDEVLQFRPDIIELQLAHAVKDPNGRAYNRTAHLPERVRMMQAWADYLDQIKREGDRTHASQ